jgi:hypothetical protein
MSRMNFSMAVIVAACAATSLDVHGAQETKSYTLPKTAWGDPDLQGIWPSTDMVSVPFERPRQFGTRRFLTDQEFAQRQKDAGKQSALDNESFTVDNVKPEVEAMGDVGGATSPPPFWLERGVPSFHSTTGRTCRRSCARIWAIRTAASRGTRSSCARRISTAPPAHWRTATS